MTLVIVAVVDAPYGHVRNMNDIGKFKNHAVFIESTDNKELSVSELVQHSAAKVHYAYRGKGEEAILKAVRSAAATSSPFSFNAKVWKQGSSHIITIPKHKYSGLNSVVELAPGDDVIVRIEKFKKGGA